jgi:DivIVA domain-containing protein
LSGGNNEAGLNPAKEDVQRYVRRRPRMTPMRIRNAQLAETRFGKRGYERDAVDELLTRIADDTQDATEEIRRLRAEIERLRSFYRSKGTDVDAETTRLFDARQVAMLSRAQAEAERTIAEAQHQAVLEMNDTRAQAAAFLERVRREAEDIRVQAELEASRSGANPAQDERLLGWLETIKRSVDAMLPALQGQFEGISRVLQWEVYEREHGGSELGFAEPEPAHHHPATPAVYPAIPERALTVHSV